MQIKFVSVMVRDQDAALHFYTTVLDSGKWPTFRSVNSGG